MKTVTRLLLAALCLVLPACDKATPTAPTGTTLTISASPANIALTGSSTITVTALKENGTPVNPGTEVRVSASLGVLDDEVIETNQQGVATTVLRGGDRIGMSEVTARSGAATEAMVTVEIGRLASNISLQADPPSIDENGGTITLRAVVRDDQGQPLPGVPVNFQSDVGTLNSGGAFVETNSNGIATDRLTVTETDLDFVTGTSFSVTAEASAAGGVQTSEALITVQRDRASAVSLQASPASIDEGGGTITLSAVVRDDQGQPLDGVLVNFRSPVGTLDSGGGFVQTNANGVATDQLRVTETDLDFVDGTGFTVTAEATGTDGIQSAETNITVQRQRAGAISLQASPTSLPETVDDPDTMVNEDDTAPAFEVDLQALVRDQQGQPLEGVLVNFLSDVGDFGGNFVDTTNSNGVAMTTLFVEIEDLQDLTPDSFPITAETSGADGAVVSTQATITVRRRPRADFLPQPNGLEVAFQDLTTGNPTSWFWDFGDDKGTSTERNPTYVYTRADTYTVTLTVRNSVGEGQLSKVVTVDAN